MPRFHNFRGQEGQSRETKSTSMPSSYVGILEAHHQRPIEIKEKHSHRCVSIGCVTKADEGFDIPGFHNLFGQKQQQD